MLIVGKSEILGALAFALLVAVTTHAVYMVRTYRNPSRRIRGRYASLCIGIGTFIGMIIGLNVNPGFSTLPVFGGMFGGWYVASRMGMLDIIGVPVPSEDGYMMDPNNPYSPPGASTRTNGDGSGEPSDAPQSRS